MIKVEFYAQCFDTKKAAFAEMMQICFNASIQPDYKGEELHHIMPVGYFAYIASLNPNMQGIKTKELNKALRNSPDHRCNCDENLVKLTHEDHMKVHGLAADCLRDDIEGKFKIFLAECKENVSAEIQSLETNDPIFSIYHKGVIAGKFIFHDDESVTMLTGSKFAYERAYSDFTRSKHDEWMKLKADVAPNGIFIKDTDISGRRNAFVFATNTEPSPDNMLMEDGTTMREFLKRKNSLQ